MKGNSLRSRSSTVVTTNLIWSASKKAVFFSMLVVSWLTKATVTRKLTPTKSKIITNKKIKGRLITRMLMFTHKSMSIRSVCSWLAEHSRFRISCLSA